MQKQISLRNRMYRQFCFVSSAMSALSVVSFQSSNEYWMLYNFTLIHVNIVSKSFDFVIWFVSSKVVPSSDTHRKLGRVTVENSLLFLSKPEPGSQFWFRLTASPRIDIDRWQSESMCGFSDIEVNPRPRHIQSNSSANLKPQIGNLSVVKPTLSRVTASLGNIRLHISLWGGNISAQHSDN